MRDTTLDAVLLLNHCFEPMSFCSARRALALIVKGGAVVTDERDGYVRPNMKFPAVIRLVGYRHIPHRKQTLSRKSILLRDRHLCQYCGHRFSPSVLTLDHVIPSSRGGRSTWENLVSCCNGCNRRKADKTPEEADMPLLHKPRQLTMHTSRFMLRSMGVEDPRWARYLYTESDERFVHQ